MKYSNRKERKKDKNTHKDNLKTKKKEKKINCHQLTFSYFFAEFSFM